MQTVFKVLNPNDGLYETFDSQELAQARAIEISWEFYLSHTHNTPVSKVTVTPEGAEIWGQP